MPSSKRLMGPTGRLPGVLAPISMTWVTPATQPTSLSSQKTGTIVWTSALCTSPMRESLLQKTSPGLIPGFSSKPSRIMCLMTSDIVWTWTMIPVERATESPSGV